MTNRPESIARVTVIRNPKHGSPGPNMLQGLQQHDKDDVTTRYARGPLSNNCKTQGQESGIYEAIKRFLRLQSLDVSTSFTALWGLG